VITGLQSPPSGWFQAIVQASVYLAATKARNGSLGYQQLAVSHAAHDSLMWTFHGTRLYATIDEKLAAILPAIGLDPNSREGKEAVKIGREAARKVTAARADDGINHYEPWTPPAPEPGNYQATPGGRPVPDTPQARYIRLFGGLGDVTRFRAPPPPKVTDPEYEEHLLYVKNQGQRNSQVRKPYDTETAYFWRESSPMYELLPTILHAALS
jgi:hypothetical protein